MSKQGQEPEPRRITLSELVKLLEDEKHKKKLVAQMKSLPIGEALQKTELKNLRIKDVARDHLMEDIADNTTASWKRSIRVSQLAKIHVLIESELFGGIINASRKQTVVDFKLLLLFGLLGAATVTLLELNPLELWFSTTFSNPVAVYTAVGLLIVLGLVVYYLWRQRKKQGR